MKRFLLLLSFFVSLHGIATSQISASEEQDRLTPAENFYDVGSWAENYYTIVKNHLISSEEDRFLSRFWALPSFSNEYFLGTMQDGDDFVVICREPEQQISADMGRLENENYIPQIVEITRRISEHDVLLLNLLIEVAVVSARFEQKILSDKDCINVTMGLDGASYFFSTSPFGFDTKTATAWSPPRDSAPRELIIILKEVITLMKDEKDEDIEFTPELEARINDLTYRFRKHIEE
ncbi:MAG: hypothetical protein LBV18_04925 [Alistipes sp.]|jgi:hypothetical protein|nr:hypothetical protein [Alistipes sp.]